MECEKRNVFNWVLSFKQMEDDSPYLSPDITLAATKTFHLLALNALVEKLLILLQKLLILSQAAKKTITLQLYTNVQPILA